MRLLVPILILILSACSGREAEPVRVEGAWIAHIPPLIRVTAALMTLHNDGTEARFLVEASSPLAERIEIHRSIVVDDLARMVRQQEVEIPAHGSLSFSNETGYHLMFYGTERLNEGQQVPVTLAFRDGTRLTVPYAVLDRRKVEQEP